MGPGLRRCSPGPRDRVLHSEALSCTQASVRGAGGAAVDTAGPQLLCTCLCTYQVPRPLGPRDAQIQSLSPTDAMPGHPPTPQSRQHRG